MKTTVKILLLAFTLALISGCSAQKRAKRHLGKAVELYPELVQVKAHPIDTFLSLPVYTDMVLLPMSEVCVLDTVKVKTEHGTIILSMGDTTLAVGFTADPQELRYQDTVRYAQVVIKDTAGGGWFDGFGERLAEWISFLVVGMAITLYLLRDALKNK